MAVTRSRSNRILKSNVEGITVTLSEVEGIVVF